MKRAIDLAVASVALLVALLLWPVIALAIRLDSRGPVLFHQQRVTRGGRISGCTSSAPCAPATPPSTPPGRSSSWSPTPG